MADPKQKPVPKDLRTHEEKCKSIALEAHNLVFGEREGDYGHPLDDFSRTAEFWSTYLQGRSILPSGVSLGPQDVGAMMILLKLSRECNKHLRDNLVDIAGYAITVERVIDEQYQRKLDTEDKETESNL